MTTPLDAWGLEHVADGVWTEGSRRGRVVRVDRGESDVMTDQGRLRVLSDSMRAQGEVAPVTGDLLHFSCL